MEKSGKVGELLKNKKSHGKVREFCCVKFIFMQSKHPKFEHFGGSLAPDPLDVRKNLIIVEKSQGKLREFHPFWRLDTLVIVSVTCSQFVY